MPRPQRQRRVCREPDYACFLPEGTIPKQQVLLSVDEFEVIRLVDLEKKTHEEAAKQMNISRTTVTEVYQSARYKLADSLVNGKKLMISGGNYCVCNGYAERCADMACKKRANFKAETNFLRKGIKIMRIAIPYENEQIFQHFGHTETFKFYDAENGKVNSTQIVGTNGNGHGALAEFLKENRVDVLICGGIGGGAKTALAQAGITLFGGVKGRADQAAEAFLEGTLQYDPHAHCQHHDAQNEAHSCGHGHSCKEHHCGGH